MNREGTRIPCSALTICFFALLLCAGGFFESVAGGFCVVMIAWLFWHWQKEKRILIKINPVSGSIFTIVLFYGISCLWAVDSGMAVFGCLKFLAIGLFLLALMQKPECEGEIKALLPYFTAGMVLVSWILMQVPMFERFFSVAGRLAGFFQYPNTFALLILVAELLLAGQEDIKKRDAVVLLILLIGMLMTGSRAVFVLAVASNIAMLVCQKNQKRKIRIAVFLLAVFAGIGIALLLSDGAGVLRRFLQFSVNETTLVGRLLYWQDALPLVASHPFGLGYMGHYYMQQSIQTGLYSVRFVHQDFLQILLDVGWIPGILLVIAIGNAFLSKNGNARDKIILATMVLHSCFDFNLQFVGMFCLLLLFLEVPSGKERILRSHGKVLAAFGGVLAGLCVYGSLVAALVQFEQSEMAHCFYPWHTQNEIERLTKTEDLDEMEEIAEQILERNPFVLVAYSAKARVAYAKGEIGELIRLKHTIFEIAPFQYEEYEEYCSMLLYGIYLYQQAGDTESVDVCREELAAVIDRLEHLNDRLSELGKKIKDQPQTELPDEIRDYIKEAI